MADRAVESNCMSVESMAVGDMERGISCSGTRSMA